MTTNPAYGRLVTLKFQGVTVLNLKASDLTQKRGKRDVTTKDSNDDEESRPTIKSRAYSLSGLMPIGGPNTAGGPALQTAYDNGTIGTVNFGDNLTGSPNWSSSGWLETLDFKAPHDGNVEFNANFIVTGTVTFGTN